MNILQKPRPPIDEEIAYVDYEGKKLAAWRGDYAANVLKLGQSTILRPYREHEAPKDWEQANIGHKFYNADGFLIGIVDGIICNENGEPLHIYLNEHNQEIEEPSSELLAHPGNTLVKTLHPVTLPLFCYRNRKTVDMASYALFPEPEIMGIEGFDQLSSSLEWENWTLHNFIPKCIIMRLLQEEGLPPPIEELHPGMAFVQAKENSMINSMDMERINASAWARGFVQVAVIESAYKLERKITIALAHSIQTELAPNYSLFHMYTNPSPTFDETWGGNCRVYKPESAMLSNESIERISREVMRQEQHLIFSTIIANLDRLSPTFPSRQQQIIATNRQELPQKYLNFIEEHMYLSAYVKKDRAILYLHSKGKDKVDPSNLEISQAYVDKVIREYEAQQAPQPTQEQGPIQGQMEGAAAIHSALTRISMHRDQLKTNKTLEIVEYNNKKVKTFLDVAEMALKGMSEQDIEKVYPGSIKTFVRSNKNLFYEYMQKVHKEQDWPEIGYKALMPKPKGKSSD